MTYASTLEYIFSRLPMFSRIGAAAYKADLTNTIQLCAHVGNPQNTFPSVHVAGTNGKGSTSHMLAAIFQTAGYKTGLYTSPHLRDFRERIKVNGGMIEEEYVSGFVERLKPMIEDITPSFFEITVAMAFEYFAHRKVDIAIVEVGLGGRLDSTNIITPELSVITNIGLDHTQLLGDSVEQIAFEKAGIIKPGIPVVIGEWNAATSPVFEEKARQQNAPIRFASKDKTITGFNFEERELVAEVTTLHTDIKNYYHLDLTGIYQTKNLLKVLEAVKVLNGQNWQLTEQHLSKALRQVKHLTGLHGRWETIHEHPTVILDVAHNEDGIREICSHLEVSSYHQLHIVIGMVKEKAVDKVLSLLPEDAHYYFTKAQIPRAMHEDELAMYAKSHNLKGLTYAEVNAALRAALSNAGKNDLILICGSVFVAGEVHNV